MADISVRLKSGEVVPMSYPDDWSQEQVEMAIHENFPDEDAEENAEQLSESEAPQSMPSEVTGFKGLKQDALDLLKDAIKGGIGFARRAPSNLGEIASEFAQHPIDYPHHVSKQALASLSEGGKMALNFPHEAIAELGRKELIPEWLKEYNELPFTHLPEDTGVEKFLGFEPKLKSDELIRAIPAIAAPAKLLKKPIQATKEFISSPDLKLALKETQKKVNQSTKNAAQVFDEIESEVTKRGINKVSVDEDIINQSQNYLSKTTANKALIERAKSGDYTALRKLQADLRVKGEKALSSSLKAENDIGEEMLANRDQINSSIQSHLEENGAEDLAKALNKTRENYRDIMQTYFSNPALAKVFGKSQKVPKNPATLLTEDSTEMNRFMSAHPELMSALQKALKHNKRKKIALTVAGALGAGATGGATYKILGGN